ncbi:MAG: NUDIX pyrophosphatase [Chloroflexi bacterium RBG_16_48_8]|nr:MAG: NUDIX pyrophosphatase [Chloroflexi bacterium RBG_16_48_8]
MVRAPFQVLIFPYLRVRPLDFEYAIFRRADEGYWHSVAGGGEDDETPLEAAKRETLEETGIQEDSAFLKLDTVFPVPVTIYRDSQLWGEDLYVIPSYCFGVLVEKDPITLSKEHLEYRWVKFEEAHRLLRFESNKLALWELDRKIRGLGPRDS